MADHGGACNGAGRPKGRSSPATLQMKATFEEMARAHAPKALEILLALARTSESGATRVTARRNTATHDATKIRWQANAISAQIALVIVRQATARIASIAVERRLYGVGAGVCEGLLIDSTTHIRLRRNAQST
jgi:hypothetical protein